MGEEQCKLIEEDLKKMLFQPPKIKEIIPQEQKVKVMDSDFYSQDIGEYSKEWPALGTDSSTPKMHFQSKREKKNKGSKFPSYQTHTEDAQSCQLSKIPTTSDSYLESSNSAQLQRRGHHQEWPSTMYADNDKVKGGLKDEESVGTDSEKYGGWENKNYGKKQFSNTSRKNKSTSRQLRLDGNGNTRYCHPNAQNMNLNGNVDSPCENSDQYALKSFMKYNDRTQNRKSVYLSSNQPASKGFRLYQDKKRDKKGIDMSDSQNSALMDPINTSVSEMPHIHGTEHSNSLKNNKTSESTSESKCNKNEYFKNCLDDQENQEMQQTKQKEKKKKKKKKDNKESKKRKARNDANVSTNSSLNALDSGGEPHDKASVITTYPRINKATSDSSQIKEIQEDLLSPKGTGENVAIQNYSPDVIQSLLNDYVILRKSKPSNTKKSHFYCQICLVSCPNLVGAQRHITTSNHKAKKEIEEFEETLKCIPSPLPVQVEVITELLIHISEEQGLSDREIKQRQNVVYELNEIIKTHLQGCSVELIGSSANGFGLKTSEVDIVLHVPSNVIPSDMLDSTNDLLTKEETYIDVTCEFKEKIPRIHFVEKKSMLKCNITLNSGSLCATAKLLNDYVVIDPRVKILGVCFRYWAKLCELDQQKKGTLPSFCFPLLLIYFLQQHKPPVLPVLHELSGSGDGDVHMDPFKIGDKWKCLNADTVGALWISLLRFYSITFRCGIDVVSIRYLKSVTCKDKNWGTKFLAIEDPYTRRNLAHSIPNHQLFRYVKDCFKLTYKYFGFPQLQTGSLSFENGGAKPQKNNIAFVSPVPDDEDQVGLKIVFTSDDESVSSTNLQDQLEDHDPDISLDSVVGTISRLSLVSSDSEEHETEILNDSPNINYEKAKRLEIENSNEKEIECSLDEKGETTHSPLDQINKLNSSPIDNKNKSKCLSKESELKYDGVVSSHSENTCMLDIIVCYPLSKEQNPSGNNWKTNGITYTKGDICYDFSRKKIIGNLFPPIICRYCQKQGHLKQHCPDLKLPDIFPLPVMTSSFLKHIDKVCKDIMHNNAPDIAEITDRDCFLLNLQDFIRQEFVEDAHLQMFGSCCNGFGFINSDMDICLTFNNEKDGDKLNHTALIETLATLLKKNRALHNVIPITSAKVPIVKFTFRGVENIEGDISLYNTLAQHNTRMLRTYCKIDKRVQILGYTMKYFAKVLDIGDASRGSLSSYAYILMVLFYLQQIDPPVIPVLQELYEGKVPERNIDGWNAWFYDDIDNLPTVWTHYNQNKQSVGELWLGLLCFYTEKFDFKEYVISIRQKEPLSRFKKLWNSKSIAIEDPFDLNHNLGSGLSRKMNLYIIKAFIRARQIFGTPILSPPPCYENIQKYLFDKELLSEGKHPPNDRGCRACGKIGHIVRDCPRRRANRSGYQRDSDQYSNKDGWKGGVLWRDCQKGLHRQKRGRPQTKPTTPPRMCLTDRFLHTQRHQNQGNELLNTVPGKKSNMAQGILTLPLGQVPGMSGGSIQSQNVPFFLHQGIQTANQISQSLAASHRQPQLQSPLLPSFAGTAAITRTTYSQSSTPNSQFTHQHLLQHQLPYGSQKLQQKSEYGLPQQHQPHVSQSTQSSVGTQQQSLRGGVQQQQSLLGCTQQQQSLLGPQPSPHLLNQQLQHIYQQQNLYQHSVPQKQQNHYQSMQQHAQENSIQPFSSLSRGIPHDSSVSNFQRNQSGNSSYPTHSHSGVPFSREELVWNNVKGTTEEITGVRGPMGFPHDDAFPKRS